MSQPVTLRFGSTPTTVLCHVGNFGCGDGAWTTVMKIDGNKVIVKLCICAKKVMKINISISQAQGPSILRRS